MNPLLLKALPYIGGALLAGGAYLWAYDRGQDAERAKWQSARVELLALRTEKKEWAAEKLAQQANQIPRAGVKETIRVETYWRDRPVRECFDADLVRSLEKAREAVRRSATSGPSDN